MRTPGQRAGLTDVQVRQEARTILVDAGADGLTMRGLADRLGVKANAIYSYTPNKLSLIEDVLDDVLADVASPDPNDDDPAASLHAMMRSTYDVSRIGVLFLCTCNNKERGARTPSDSATS